MRHSTWQPSFKASVILSSWCFILSSALPEHGWSSQGVGESFHSINLSIKRTSREKSIKKGFEIIQQQNVLMLLHKHFDYWWAMLQNRSHHPGPCSSPASCHSSVAFRALREAVSAVCLWALCLWGLALTLQDLGTLLHSCDCATLCTSGSPLLHFQSTSTWNW